MSRSYRAPIVTDGYGSKSKQWYKRWANRIIRHSTDMPDGKAYRKFFETYDICDYKWECDISKEDEPWKIIRK